VSLVVGTTLQYLYQRSYIMRHLLLALPISILSISACAKVVHTDHVFVKKDSVLASSELVGKLTMDHGHLKNGKCQYNIHDTIINYVPLDVNKMMTFPTKASDIEGDVGRGFTCMKYTLQIKGKQQSVSDEFKINLDNHGNYISSDPSQATMNLQD
jgi:hypothetical protein